MPPACEVGVSVWNEGEEESISHLVANQLDNRGGSGVGDGNNLDQLGIVNVLGLGRPELALEVDAPVGAQPEQRLDAEDGAAPHKGPLLGANVLLVEFIGEVVAEEDGPGDGERPHVGVQVEGQRTQQLRLRDLRVVDEGRHGGLNLARGGGVVGHGGEDGGGGWGLEERNHLTMASGEGKGVARNPEAKKQRGVG